MKRARSISAPLIYDLTFFSQSFIVVLQKIKSNSNKDLCTTNLEDNDNNYLRANI